MTPDKIIKLLQDNDNNAVLLQASRVIYVPDDDPPVHLVAQMQHIESSLRYVHVIKMTPEQAVVVANALLIQGTVADPPPPSF